jgi:hypothetical protein
MTRLLLATAAAAAMMALPTFAQAAPKARAHAAAAQVRQPVATPQANAVYDEYGHYIGADPDPNIRFQLMREYESLFGN